MPRGMRYTWPSSRLTSIPKSRKGRGGKVRKEREMMKKVSKKVSKKTSKRAQMTSKKTKYASKKQKYL